MSKDGVDGLSDFERKCTVMSVLMSTLIENKRRRAVAVAVAAEEGDREEEEEEEEGGGHEERSKVVSMFQKRFDILSQLNSGSDQDMVSPEEVEEARTYVGLAKARHTLEAYLYAAKQDKGRLLNWKGKRNGMEKVRKANTGEDEEGKEEVEEEEEETEEQQEN